MLIIKLDDVSKREKIRGLINPDNVYTKIKFKNEIYAVNDFILVRPPELSEKNYLIGKILRIISANGIDKYSYWPSVEVLW